MTTTPADPTTAGRPSVDTGPDGPDGPAGAATREERPAGRRRRTVRDVLPGPVAKAGLIGGVATASGIALTATSGWLIVRADQRPVILTLLTAIVAVRAFGMARPVFRYWERLLSHDAALGALAERRTAVYRALVPLTPARLGRRRRSDVLTGVVDDLTDEVEAQVRVTVPVVSTAVAGVATVALTTALAPPAGLALVTLAVVVVLGCLVAARLESRSLTALLDARADVTGLTQLATTQASELQAVGAWPTVLRRLDAAQAVLTAATRRTSRGRATASALFPVAVAGTVAWVAVVVGGLGLPTPVTALLVVTPVAVADAVAPLVDAMRARARASAASQRVRALTSMPPAVVERPGAVAVAVAVAVIEAAEDADGGPEARPHLRLDGVAAAWGTDGTDDSDGIRRDSPDLGPVDLDLPFGSRVLVTGPNGSGKSTLLAVQARHLDPVAGRYAWDGVDVTDLTLSSVRAQVALVDDDPHVFASTLRANLLLARPEADDDALTAALTSAGLAPLLAGLPDGLDTVLGTGGRGLSGGERARLAVARAVLSRRPVLLLDEPVAHLDAPTARAVLVDLLAVPDRTVVMVTHRPDGADLFDRVVDLGRGHPTAPDSVDAP
ncbi:ATP-binding cassette subfamily C protein CydC [Terracoccus luteus]|uniref:ATP-binding cassette subfamily C protein CydC n=1 Tax=Terracoccus luteus TaxID=53356 RepID=A0A495XZF1_9MICO|nr:thiol reductant ABC exporter subunit CydC [Terracoccus luteus]RKT79990.1 ATP-binding cassette subfamily C protein CydC [Terracoccus luteus]